MMYLYYYYDIYLLLSSTIFFIRLGVKNRSKIFDGESGMGTVRPTGDWKGWMVTGRRVLDHWAGVLADGIEEV